MGKVAMVKTGYGKHPHAVQQEAERYARPGKIGGKN